MSTEGSLTPVETMALAFPAFFLVAADLTLASALSCLLYVLACFSLAGLTSFVMFYSSFEAAKKMKAKMNQKGRHAVLLASSSSAGQVLLTILDKAGFRMWAVCQLPEEEGAQIQKKECNSTIGGTHVPVAEHEHQKKIQVYTKSHLKGISWGGIVA